MDWTGQKRAEAACLYAVVILGVIAFVVGFASQDFLLMMKVRRGGAERRRARSLPPFDLRVLNLPPSLFHSQIYGSGVAATALALIPDWPWFNRDPLTWLPVREVVAESKVEGGVETEEEDGEEEDAGEEVAASPAGGRQRQRRLPVVE